MSSPKLFKIITAGDGGVGKTTLLHRYVKGKFLEETLMTIGVQFHLKELQIDNDIIYLQVWDFGGQEHFRPLLSSYASGARGALLLFDLTRPSSLDRVEQWVNICRGDNPGIPIIFLGTKLDLTNLVAIEDNYALMFLERYNFLKYMKISSKTGENVNLAFELLATEILKNI